MANKPLFIPLKRKFFNLFDSGEKTTEYRVYGARWNERTCAVGRPVVLSLGYGKHHRLIGFIKGFKISYICELGAPVQQAWRECFPNDYLAACIQIEIQRGER